jgi:inner membrane protein
MILWHLGVTAAVIFLTLGRRGIDYRMVMFGALLPDLIDKPIGRVFFADQFENGRIFAHTLLFSTVLLLGIQLFLRGRTARRWFIVPIAAVIHQVLDGMWNEPVTFFWPLFTTRFPRDPVGDYWLRVLMRPLEEPIVLLQEVIGLALLLYIASAYRLWERDRRTQFIRTGYLTDRPVRTRPKETDAS